jgi:hypothetical protein
VERKNIGFGREFYRYLIKNDFPPGYQVLCYNCNSYKEYIIRRSGYDTATVSIEDYKAIIRNNSIGPNVK